MSKKDADTKLDIITTREVKQTIPFIVYENSETRHERREKRNTFIIVLLIFLLMATNGCWLWYESQFEEIVRTETSYDIKQEAETGNNTAHIVDNYGETNSNSKNNNN